MRTLLKHTRVRLTLTVAAVFLVVAGLAAAGLWLTFSRLEYTAVDSSLSAQAQTVLSGLEDVNGKVSFHGGEGLPAQTPDGIAVEAVLVDGQGKVLDRTANPPSSPPIAQMLQQVVRSGTTQIATVSANGHDQRVLVQSTGSATGTSDFLVVARPVRELETTLLELGALLIAAVLVLTVVVALLAYRLSARALRPVRSMAATAREISEHDLQRRIDLDLPPDEMGELAATFNSMLARIDAAFTALHQFTADAAHELRAPLAMLRAELEVSLSKARSPAEYRASQQIALAEVERLSAVADQLLTLARSDSGALTLTWEQVDLGDLLEEIVERWRPLASTRHITLTAGIEQEGVQAADPQLLRRLFDNLLDNAIRHTPEAGAVRVTLSTDLEAWTIVVSDTGPGVAAPLRRSLFQRFVRGDAARGRDTGGAGLGLALCRVIVELHGGTITLDDARVGAAFRIRLPRIASPKPVAAG